MWVSKRTYEDLLRSHKREVDILTDWVAQLQSQLGANFPPRAPAREPSQAEMIDQAISLHVGDEEQDMLDALDMNLITKDQFDQWKREQDGLNVEVTR